MPRLLFAVCIAFLLATVSTAVAQDPATTPGHEHHHHAADPAEKLGQVHFPASCAPQSQAPMERGIALLHSFGYTTARLQFEAIAASDPTCAIAHWGIAMTQYQEIWGHPNEAQLKRGAEEIARAHTLAAPPATTTPRELAYINALGAFFTPTATPFQERASAYETKMNALHRSFPDDVEPTSPPYRPPKKPWPTANPAAPTRCTPTSSLSTPISRSARTGKLRPSPPPCPPSARACRPCRAWMT